MSSRRKSADKENDCLPKRTRFEVPIRRPLQVSLHQNNSRNAVPRTQQQHPKVTASQSSSHFSVSNRKFLGLHESQAPDPERDARNTDDELDRLLQAEEERIEAEQQNKENHADRTDSANDVLPNVRAQRSNKTRTSARVPMKLPLMPQPTKYQASDSDAWSNYSDDDFDVLLQRAEESLTVGEQKNENADRISRESNAGIEWSGDEAGEQDDADDEGSAEGRVRFKRRVRNPISAVRQQRKLARNRGEEYTNSSGVIVPQKLPLPLTKCRSGCSERLPSEVCRDLCQNVWQGLGSYDKRSSYIANLVEVKPKASHKFDSDVPESARKNRNLTFLYHVIVDGKNVKVCKGCFINIFRVSSKFIDLAVKKKLSTRGGIISNDRRGQASNPLEESRRTEVVEFLSKIPKYKSHYARNETDGFFLPSHLTLKSIFDEYCRSAVTKAVSRWSFEKIFYESGLKIKPWKIDTCAKCDKLDAAVTYSKTPEERQKNQESLDQHHEKWEAARDKKKEDIRRAREDPKVITVAFDLQQCLPTPFLQASIVFYLRQLWTYNLTIHNCGSKDSTHNMWHEGEGERGPNQIGSSLYHYILNLPDEVEELILWSDTCGGQNKNSIVAAALSTALLHKPSLARIEQKFLVPGHTHMECDTDHSTIEGCKKRASCVQLPRDWMTLVRNASPNFTVYHLKTNHQMDFKSLLKGRQSPLVKRKKDTAGNQFVWKDVVWMRHERGRPGVVAFKTSHDEEKPFGYHDIRRKRNAALTLSPESLTGPLPISHKKKQDLISLLDLIDPDCAPFYMNLRSDKDAEDFLPDILPSSDEEESSGEE